LISFLAPLAAQRKYAGSSCDWMCAHDLAVVDRVLSAISKSPEEKRRLFTGIEGEASEFVDQHWASILKLAKALFERNTLSKREIELILAPRARSADLSPTWGRALPRRPGDEPDFFRRVDGYFR
jgi:hypothetical protein